MYITKAILYYVCAVLWLLRTVNRPNIFDAVLTAALLICGIVHTVRFVRQKSAEKEKKYD